MVSCWGSWYPPAVFGAVRGCGAYCEKQERGRSEEYKGGQPEEGCSGGCPPERGG